MEIASYLEQVNVDAAEVCFEGFANEQTFDSNLVSGIDLRKKCKDGNCHNEGSNEKCSFASSRYICDDITN